MKRNGVSLLGVILLLMMGLVLGQAPAHADPIARDPASGGVVYQATCPSPRPAVRLQTEALGDGRIQTTITAGVPPLTLIRFGTMQNAHIEVPGDSKQYGSNSEIKPPSGAASMTFLLVGDPAAQAGQAPPPTTVPLTVFDGCGPSQPWSTFFGGGAQALQSTASIADAEVREGNTGNTAMTLTIKLSVPSSRAVSVNYETRDGTAKAGTDYVAANGTVTFNAGETSKNITVQIRGNFAAEPDKTFTVVLSSPSNASIGRGTATARILNDDTGANASGDSYTATIGQTLNVGAGSGPPPGLLVNDPNPSNDAQITSFGGLSAGGDVTSNSAGSTRDLGNGGSLKVNADGSFSFTPPSNASGSFSFRYRSNSSAGTAEATVTIDVRKLPNAVDDPSYSATGSTALTVNASSGVLANDDLGAPPSGVSAFGGGSAGGSVTSTNAGQTKDLGNGGNLRVNADGSFSFSPPTGFSGNFTFQYRLTNAAGSDDATVTINVSSGPNAQNDALAVTAGGALSGNLTADNGSGADSLGLPAATVTSIGGGDLTGSVTSFTTPATRPLAGGTLTVAADGTIGLSGANAPGTYTFQYRLTNSTGSDDATVTITVQKAPAAQDDTGFTTAPVTPITQGAGTLFADNGNGADDRGFPQATISTFGGGTLTTFNAGDTVTSHPAGGTAFTFGAGGSLAVGSDGGFSFTPPTGFTGPFTFQYRLTNVAGSDDATVTIQVQSVPVTTADAFTVLVSTPLSGNIVTADNGSGLDSPGVPPYTQLTFGGGDLGGTVTTNTASVAGTGVALAGGTLTVKLDGSITLTPTTPGNFTFQYQLANASGPSNISTVSIQVRQAPTANDDDGAAFTVQPGNTLTGPTGTLFANNNHGADVLGVPAATIVTFGGGSLGGTVDDINAGTTVTLPPDGTLVVNADGGFSFKPATGFTGAFTFEYRLSNVAGTDTATVTIQVQAPPVAQPDTFTITVGGANLSGNVTAANPSTPDNLGVPAATVTSYGGPATGGADTVTSHAAGTNTTVAGGTFSIASTGAITLTGATTPGDYTLQYRLTNVAGTSDGTITIHVQQVPDAKDDTGFSTTPATLLTRPAGTLFADNGSGADVLGVPAGTITAFGGGTLGGTVDDNTAGATSTAGGHSLTVGADGSFSFTPAPAFTGAFTFQYRLANAAGSDTATVTIQVQRPPDAKDDAFSVTVGGANLSGNLVTTDNGSGIDDAGVPAATVTSIGGGNLGGSVTTFTTPASQPLAGGTLTVAANGAITLNGATTGGTYTFQYRLTNVAGTDDATVTITVNQVPFAQNDGPSGTSVPGDAFHTPLNTQFNLAAGGLFANNGSGADVLGFPAATITSFGGGTLGGTVDTNNAGATATGAGHSLTVNADGSVVYQPATGFTGLFTFDYRLANVAGSDTATVTIAVGARPDAVDKTYSPTIVGNVPIDTAKAGGTGFNLITGSAGTADDTKGDQLTFSIVGSPTGGTVTLNPDNSGRFRFVPNAGFTGAASFTYRVTNGFGTDDATVSLTVSNLIWFVDDSAGAGGDGRLGTPFQSLSPLQGGTDPDGTGDFIFLYTGTYTTGLPLENNQWFIGQGASLATALTDRSITPSIDSDPLPGTGTAPSINTTSGDGLTLANDNTIRGVNFGPSAGNAIGASGKGGTTSITGVTITATTGGNGVNLTTQTGTLNVSNLDVTTASGTAFSMTGGGTAPVLNVTNGSTINAVSGQGLILSTVNAGASNITFDTLTSGGGTNNVSLTNVGGTGSLTLGASGNSLTNASGAAFNVSGGGVNVTYSGNITSGLARSVSVVNRTGGTVAFTGSVTDNDTGILLDNNDQSGGNGVVTFRGGITASTGGNAAFTATNGGTVNVCNTNDCASGTAVTNTLTTTTGTALNVANTTIGSSGLKFQSISAGTAASGPTNGIVLNTTGTSGGLTVTGTGAANSGGTIQRTPGDGISLSNTRDVSFNNMNIQNTAGSGVRGDNDVHNFSFTNGTMNNTGSSSGPAGGNQASSIAFNDPTGSATNTKVSGTVTVTGNTLTNALWHGVSILQFAGTLDDVNISNNTLTSGTTTGTGGSSFGSGIQLFVDGNGSTSGKVTRAELNGNTITNFPGGVLIAVQCGTANSSGPTADCGTVGSATNDIEIKSNFLNGGGTTPDGAGGFVKPNQIMLLTVNGRGQGQFTIQNNGSAADPLSGSAGNIIDISAGGAVTVQATVTGNRMDAAGQTVSGTSGIAAGVGPFTVTGPTTLSTATLYATVQNNNVTNSAGSGIRLNVNAGDPTLNAIVTGNTVTAPISATYGIQVQQGPNAGFTGNTNLEISGNTTTGGTGGGNTFPGIGLRKFGTASGEFSIVGLTPSPATNAQMESNVAGQNPGSASGTFGTGGVAAVNGTSSNWTSIASVPQP